MANFLSDCHKLVWGAPLLVLILGVGIYLSLRLGFPQICLLPKALASFWRKLTGDKDAGDGVSSFQALCTALAATVGTGNLVGVAGAICLGGPGAIFWMWVCGFASMATKFAEATLAVRYRTRGRDGWRGGPMYMICQGLGRRWYPLAWLYSLFGLLAAFGVGNATQTNAVITGVNSVLAGLGVSESMAGNLLIGGLMAILVGRLLWGGAKRIGNAAQMLVPLAAVGYLVICAGVLLMRANAIPGALCQIFQGAFSPRAVTGGLLGSSFQALRIGCSRGVFTNEAGMGTAAMAHAGAQVAHPAEQGLMGIVEVFLDTIVICTLTALVILVSGVPIPYGVDAGGTLTLQAFSSVYGGSACILLTAALCCFAVATVLGWGLYGVRCAQFLFGGSAWRGFALIQAGTVLLSAAADSGLVWQLSEIVNGLMAIPNLIALAVLSPELVRLTKDYKKTGILDASGGKYANFHQCKPL